MRGYDSAELILTCLEEHPGGLNMKVLLSETGLRSGQYRSAYNWTLDNFDEPIWVKNYVGGEWVYLTIENARDCMEDWKRTNKTQVTRARREHNKIRAIANRHPTLAFRESELEAKHRLERLQFEKDRLSE